jgi:hypothetical protein
MIARILQMFDGRHNGRRPPTQSAAISEQSPQPGHAVTAISNHCQDDGHAFTELIKALDSN